jgi:hypothetical protein
MHTCLRVASKDGRVATNVTHFSTICFIIGRSAGFCFQQSSMRFQTPSSITGHVNRGGRALHATSWGICNCRFSRKGTQLKNIWMSPNILGGHTKKKMRGVPHSVGSRKHTHLSALFLFHLPLDSNYIHCIQIDNIFRIWRTTLGQQNLTPIMW